MSVANKSNDFSIQIRIRLGCWCIFCNGVAHVHEMASLCHIQKKPESWALENFFLKPLLIFLVARHLILPVEFGRDEPIVIEYLSSLFYNISIPRIMCAICGGSRGRTSHCSVCPTMGVLERQPASEWALPLFIIPKKDKTICLLSEFWEVNKRLEENLFQSPK